MEKVKLPRAANASFVKLPTPTSVPLIKKSKDLVSFVLTSLNYRLKFLLPMTQGLNTVNSQSLNQQIFL